LRRPESLMEFLFHLRKSHGSSHFLLEGIARDFVRSIL
jgi:hypothetical protein